VRDVLQDNLDRTAALRLVSIGWIFPEVVTGNGVFVFSFDVVLCVGGGEKKGSL